MGATTEDFGPHPREDIYTTSVLVRSHDDDDDFNHRPDRCGHGLHGGMGAAQGRALGSRARPEPLNHAWTTPAFWCSARPGRCWFHVVVPVITSRSFATCVTARTLPA